MASLICGLHPTIKRKVRTATVKILADPYVGKALKDDLEGLRSFKIGRIRLVYRTVSRGIVEIVALGPRGTIYEETLRLVKREDQRHS